ncbi:MAG: oxygen-independent coproporphyrinogen III oxidase [Acidocella sp.]|nr:oxygen-independent coproporphyrinogen III oxidase [Acidocella sp.]
MTDADLIARYDGRVPRYTSYPTAPHFHPGIGAEAYAGWLASLPLGAPISLYLHVPFCDRLCLYCGCNTTVVRQERPRRAYAAQLMREIALVADAIGQRAQVGAVHWGGGTPTMLPGDCLVAIMDLIRERFTVLPGAEVAIEIDPASMPEDGLSALARMGVTRASLGVQDFNPVVQEAIGREQSFEETEDCAKALRSLGITSLNLDLIYGLPHQTVASVQETARRALTLWADRVAVFGYAHVPWMKKHQALIPEASLPGAAARFAQAKAVARVLEREGGYVPVGLDHYARPGDSMADAAMAQTLHRSFQGYTTDAAPVLIGLGASAIGSLPQGYVQNAPGVPAYAAAIDQGHFAIAKGVALTQDDRLRRAVIERVMCDLEVDLVAQAQAFDEDPQPLLTAAEGLAPFVADGLVDWDGRCIRVRPEGRPFVRNIAALFDSYLVRNDAVKRHAQAV